MIIKGKEIIPFTRRISFDTSQLKLEDSAFWSLCIKDLCKNYVYCIDQTDLDKVKAFLTEKQYIFGTDEDITPVPDIQAWLDSQEEVMAGSESKSELYDKLHIQYPDQECIDARA